MNEALLRDELVRDEGWELAPYKDSKGWWTVGVGHNLDAHGQRHDRPYTEAECDAFLTADIAEATTLLDRHTPWWVVMTEVRQRALLNMCFQMGWGDGTHGLSSFHRTLGYMELGRYDAAATSAARSKWATVDSPVRAKRVIAMIREG